MKLFSIIGVILFLTKANANDLDLLKQCQVSCNSSCRTLALKLKPIVDAAEGCTGATEVTRRCDYHFSGTQAQICAANASSIEVVNRCYYHFSNSDAGSRCAAAGKSVDHVNGCVSKYGSGQSGLTCIAGQ
ncbi:MAG: hypothetical protein JNM24_15975 [Bdellovibrionaceae bacterium]|nr:hypothetical protein [Pseudobdellovibrionaceae bacterium]